MATRRSDPSVNLPRHLVVVLPDPFRVMGSGRNFEVVVLNQL